MRRTCTVFLESSVDIKSAYFGPEAILDMELVCELKEQLQKPTLFETFATEFAIQAPWYKSDSKRDNLDTRVFLLTNPQAI